MTILQPADDPLTSTKHTYVEVTNGEVGATISLNTVAEWSQSSVGVNQASGIVTSTSVRAGAEVGQGSVLYAVDLRPVSVAEGEVPMFRQIASGAQGADVRQLQEMLRALGHYDGASDGRVEAGTTAAIKRWQQSLNLEKTGVVERGDVIFVPQLPARLALDAEKINRGASLAGGETAVRGLSAHPKFWIPASDGQAALIPAGTVVEVTAPDGQIWKGVAAGQKRDTAANTITVEVTGPDDGVLCQDSCAQVPVLGQTTLPSKVVTVEQASGLVVPSSALVTTASGQVAVVDREGERRPVQVVASAKGMSVISGVDEGIRVRVPATNEPTG